MRIYLLKTESIVSQRVYVCLKQSKVFANNNVKILDPEKYLFL